MTAIDLPTPAEAMHRSLDAWRNDDRSAAAYFLEVARELRQGQRPAEVKLRAGDTLLSMTDLLPFLEHYRIEHADMSVCEHEPYATVLCGVPSFALDGTGKSRATHEPSDVTAIMDAVSDRPTCAACGGETFMIAGRSLHRATHAFECEYATYATSSPAASR